MVKWRGQEDPTGRRQQNEHQFLNTWGSKKAKGDMGGKGQRFLQSKELSREEAISRKTNLAPKAKSPTWNEG